MDKNKKAKKIMLESGFVSKYHHILNVIKGNMDSVVVRHETSVILWACDVLKREIEFLKKKHPRFAKELQDEYLVYYENVRTLHNRVLDEIFINIKKKYGNDKKEADNSN